jgi:diguanylate cyclase (GGDEF)-like protein
VPLGPYLRSLPVADHKWFKGAPLAALLGVCVVAAGIVALLFWSTASVDQMSRQRQQTLVANVLANSSNRIAYEQESVTVWDDPIRQLESPQLDLVWMDADLGIWMHDYYGHDSTYVLGRDDTPIYSMVEGRRGVPQDFARVRPSVMPLVDELRAKMRADDQEHLADNRLSPGVSDNLILDGHPAIVSVKPIVSDSGNIEQVPGSEFVHVSVRRLDSGFVDEIREQYGFTGARFSTTRDLRDGESAQPLQSRSGAVIGYFVWRHFAPGASVFARIAPVLIAVFALIGMIVLLLMRRIANRTRELRESNAAVQHLAFHDALTGLPNRALFEDRVNHALKVYRRTADHRVALLYLDLDRFKTINDTLGHVAGDQLICEFANRLSACIKPTDTVARLGGDEFAIIQVDISSPAEIEKLCQTIVAEAARPFALGASQAHVGVSIGVALAGRDGLDITELARKADIALYEAKGKGRGQYRLFVPAMDEPIRARQNAERDLRAALESKDQLSVVYQPTYSANTGAVTGVEALIRWAHPESGNVPPAVFIPVAEETGVIEALGEWVMERACREAKDWPIDTLSINVSPVQLRRPMFALRAIAIISEVGIAAERIEFEITETAILQDAAQCAVNLRLLREFGIRIALDDFGTGYSSFRHFNDFQVDRVKIDRTFVDKINVAEGGSAIIQAMVDLAHSSGFRTTAEGVETEEQKAFLERIGCDDLQGFLLAHPVARAEIDELFGLERETEPAPTPPPTLNDELPRDRRTVRR